MLISSWVVPVRACEMVQRVSSSEPVEGSFVLLQRSREESNAESGRADERLGCRDSVVGGEHLLPTTSLLSGQKCPKSLRE